MPASPVAAPAEEVPHADEAEHIQPYHNAPPVQFRGGVVPEDDLVAALAPYEEALDRIATHARV
eukprot:10304362-Prorocentrum_lima.AAC.1